MKLRDEYRGIIDIEDVDIVTDTEDEFSWTDKNGNIVGLMRNTEVFWWNMSPDDTKEYLEEYAKNKDLQRDSE